MSLFLALLIQACPIGPPPAAGWVDLFGVPLCPPDGVVQRETPENLAHVQSANFVQPGYPMNPSITGELAYFQNPAHAAIAAAQRTEAALIPVEGRIIEHLGIDIVPLGDVTVAVTMTVAPKVHEITLSFSSGAVYQYFRRYPDVPNGRTVIILHGCGSSAKTVALGQEEDYMAFVGNAFSDEGWEVIVPYVNSYCYMDNQVDKLGQMSGVNHLAYEIMGIRKVIEHASVDGQLSIYGMSKGGILALFIAALDSGMFDTVTISGHNVFDYLLTGKSYFASPQRGKNFAYAERWGRYITADELVIDYMTDNRQGIAITEMSTHDSNNGRDTETMTNLIDSCKALFSDCANRLRIVWFSGIHQVPNWYCVDAINGVCSVPFHGAN